MKEQENYYAKLYTKNPKVKFQLKNRTGVKLGERQRCMLDEPIQLDELTTALKSFAAEKSPGVDGVSAKLYVALWDILGPMYLGAIQHAIQNGKLNISSRRGILTVILKKDKNPLFLANWRPLTMLTV